MPKGEQMEKVTFFDPLDEVKSRAAKKQQGARVAMTTAQGVEIFESPIPVDVAEQVERKNREDFAQAEAMKKMIGEN